MLVDNEGRSSGMTLAGGLIVTRGEEGGDDNVVEEIGSIIGVDNPEELATKLARRKRKKADHDCVLLVLWSLKHN
jgi:hypothetical protein